MKKIFFIAVVFALISVVSSYSKSEQSLLNIIEENHIDGKLCQVCKDEFKSDTGKKLKYTNKEFDFCSKACMNEFKSEPISYTNGVARCPICDEDDAVGSITSKHSGVKYYFCNDGCKKTFEKNPKKALEKYN